MQSQFYQDTVKNIYKPQKCNTQADKTHTHKMKLHKNYFLEKKMYLQVFNSERKQEVL